MPVGATGAKSKSGLIEKPMISGSQTAKKKSENKQRPILFIAKIFKKSWTHFGVFILDSV